MFDVDATIEARGVAIATFGEYDALAGPPSQGSLGGGYGTAFGIRLGRTLTPFIGFEQGYLACSECSSKASYENMFFGLRYETPNEGTFRFHVGLDVGYRSVRESNPSLAFASSVVYGPDAVASAFRWSGVEPRLSVGPTLRLGAMAALDLSLTGALASFTRIEWNGAISTVAASTKQTSMSIPEDKRRMHGFVGLTLTARAILPLH